MNEYSISLGEVEEKIDELPDKQDADWDEKYKLYKAIDLLKDFLRELEELEKPAKKGKSAKRRRR